VALNVTSSSLTISAIVIEAVCARVCGRIRCVVSFTVAIPRTHRYSSVRSIFSFLPPSTTLRGYQRQSLATTASEIGSVYCSIVSYATSSHLEDSQNVIQNLIAIRLKLKRSIVLRANIIYEVSRDLHGVIPLSDEGCHTVFIAWTMASSKIPEDPGNPTVHPTNSLSERRSFAHGLFLAKLPTFFRI
jgi:hypothetical protein